MSVVEEIFRLFEERGDAAYFGEAVSQKEHALQAARLAAQAGAPSALIAAALLHDIGHLLHGHEENIADDGIDGRHEAAGEAWLSRLFGPEVAGPVGLHVAAKRYLCAVDAEYVAQLSPASIKSLELQGGPFDEREAREFETNPHFHAATCLRRWDDEAKVPGLQVPGLEQDRAQLEEALVGNGEMR